jgi:hypothetical protein
VRAPAEFVVLRHLLGHPDDSPAEIAKHCKLHDTSARTAVQRIRARDDPSPSWLFFQLQHAREKPRHRQFNFQVANPDQFLVALKAPHWLSGEYAAAMEGFDIVPEQAMLYIREADLPKVSEAAKESFAKVAPASKANVIVRIADPWLNLRPDEPMVERGQRLLDYQESRHLQILKDLDG